MFCAESYQRVNFSRGLNGNNMLCEIWPHWCVHLCCCCKYIWTERWAALLPKSIPLQSKHSPSRHGGASPLVPRDVNTRVCKNTAAHWEPLGWWQYAMRCVFSPWSYFKSVWEYTGLKWGLIGPENPGVWCGITNCFHSAVVPEKRLFLLESSYSSFVTVTSSILGLPQ